MREAFGQGLGGGRPLGSLGQAFFRWWGAELEACLPMAALRRFFGLDDALVVRIADDAWTVLRDGGGTLQELARVAADGIGAEAGAAERLRRVLAGAGAARLVVELPADRALRKTLRLPASAEANLRQVLGFEIERQTPFPAQQVHCHHRIVRRLPAAGPLGASMIEVELTAVPRTAVDPALARLGEIGCTAAAIRVPAGAAAPPALIPLAEGQAGARLWTPLNRVLAAATALAGAAAIASPLAINHLESRAMEAEIARLAPEMRAVLAQRETRQKAEAMLAELVKAKSAAPSAVRVLDALTRALPDDTWLTHVTLSGNELIVDGLSASAAGLARPVESSPAFARLTFRAPVTRDPATQRERFQFAIELAPPKP